MVSDRKVLQEKQNISEMLSIITTLNSSDTIFLTY